MSREVFARVGSGTVEFVAGILPSGQRGYLESGNGVRGGTQVMIANPEDLLAVPAFVASGITVGTTSVEIVGPHKTQLPFVRKVVISNGGSQAFLIGEKQNFTDIEGFEIAANGTVGDSISLDIMKNVSVWARTTILTTNVKVLIF